MANQKRWTAKAHEEVECLGAVIADVIADGTVLPCERRRLMAQFQRAVSHTRAADMVDALSIGVKRASDITYLDKLHQAAESAVLEANAA